MDFQLTVVSTFVALQILLTQIFASGKVKLRFMEFVNYNNRLVDGSFCEPTQDNECDIYFKSCLFQGKTTDMSSYKCPRDMAKDMSRKSTFEGEVINFDKITNLGNGLKNPLEWTFQEWIPESTLYIEAWDSDFASASDYVDFFKIAIRMQPEPFRIHATTEKFTVRGERALMPSALTVAMSINCDQHFYGNRCKVYCKADEHNLHKPYVCARNTGIRICTAHWHGPLCDKPCVLPQNTTGKFKCDVDGDIICQEGWYGQLCNISCRVPLDPNQHFYCNQNGSLHCQEHWFGTRCNIYCKPDDRAEPTYKCSSNGSKICERNWYGENCSTYCQEDKTNLPTYICLANGTKQCLESWYGENCSTYCQPTNNSRTSYTCNSDGSKRCQESWFGDNCSFNCDPGLLGWRRNQCRMLFSICPEPTLKSLIELCIESEISHIVFPSTSAIPLTITSMLPDPVSSDYISVKKSTSEILTVFDKNPSVSLFLAPSTSFASSLLNKTFKRYTLSRVKTIDIVSEVSKGIVVSRPQKVKTSFNLIGSPLKDSSHFNSYDPPETMGSIQQTNNEEIEAKTSWLKDKRITYPAKNIAPSCTFLYIALATSIKGVLGYTTKQDRESSHVTNLEPSKVPTSSCGGAWWIWEMCDKRQAFFLLAIVPAIAILGGIMAWLVWRFRKRRKIMSSSQADRRPVCLPVSRKQSLLDHFLPLDPSKLAKESPIGLNSNGCSRISLIDDDVELLDLEQDIPYLGRLHKQPLECYI